MQQKTSFGLASYYRFPQREERLDIRFIGSPGFMTDEQLKNLWVEFYPIRQSINEADTICRLLCEIIQLRADSTVEEDPSFVKAGEVCKTIGIPKPQFWAVMNSKPNPLAR